MREMRWSEVKCKDLRVNGQEVMGCSDSHWQRYGSGEAGMLRAAGGGESDRKVEANKNGGNGTGIEWWRRWMGTR